jgi:hypothetical protein
VLRKRRKDPGFTLNHAVGPCSAALTHGRGGTRCPPTDNDALTTPRRFIERRQSGSAERPTHGIRSDLPNVGVRERVAGDQYQPLDVGVTTTPNADSA